MFFGDKVRSCCFRPSVVPPGAGSFNPPVEGQIQVVVFLVVFFLYTPVVLVALYISFLLRVKIAVFCGLLPDIFGSCNLHRVFGDKVRSCCFRSSTVLPGAGSFNPPVDGQIPGSFVGGILYPE